MDLSTLWIGDEVKIISSGEIGIFEGVKETKADVRVGKQRFLVAASDISLYEPETEEEDLDAILELTPPKRKKTSTFSSVLDLHLDKLHSYSPDSGQPILDYQIKQCQIFLDELIRRKLSSATIIHGKGSGVLREHILGLLAGYQQIKVKHPKNDGGAVEILLFY